MRKLLLSIIILLAMAGQGWATTYYAQGDGNMHEIEWDTVSGGGGTDLVWANRLAGDVFNANNRAINIAADPGVSGNKVVLTNPAGGSFTVVGNITVTADVGVDGDRGTADCLIIQTGTVTVLGNIYGGKTTTGADGLYISGAATVTIGSAGTPVTIKGGSAINAYGINVTNAAIPMTIYGDISGGSTYYSAKGLYSMSSGNSTITGNVTGNTAPGVDRVGSGTITLTGNMEDNAAMAWINYAPVWTVGNTYYHKLTSDEVLYVSTDPTEAKVATGTSYYIQGVAKTGSMASGGGGAWGF